MKTLLLTLTTLVLFTACGKPAAEPAAATGGAADGPASIVLPADLDALVAKADPKQGEALYVSKGCKACHNLTDQKLVGPGFKGVSSRRSVAWMGKMILKPEVMIKEDEEAKKLFAAMMTPMANQNVAADTELPALLAFLKTL